MDVEALFRKLKLDDSKRILILNAPKEFENLIQGLGYDKIYLPENKGQYDYIQIFGTCQHEMEELTLSVKGAGKYDGIFWLCYPKGGSAIKCDMKRDIVWSIFLIIGLRPVTQIAIDDTWTALRGRRLELIKKIE